MDLVALIWLGLVILFVVVEAACPIHLVSIWFAAGSLTALAVWALGGPLWLQITLFLAVSCILLAALWPLTKKFLIPDSQPPTWTVSSAPPDLLLPPLTMWQLPVR